jgi:adenosine deaminase
MTQVNRYPEPSQSDKEHHATDDLYETIRKMPKIELHRHLEGSLRLATLIDIAREYDIELPGYEVEAVRPFVQMMPTEAHTMPNFMAKFQFLRQFFLSEEVIRRMTREVVIDAAEDNVKYMELRFTPKALCNIVKCSPHDAVAWVCETVEETVSGYDIQVNLIVSMNRHESLEIGEEAMKAALAHRHMGVVGLDLAGIESGYSAVLFRDLFQRARTLGLGVTLHAGEWEGAQSVWDAVGNVGVDRIGHGIRVLEDPGIVSILVEKGIILEVCPSSNVDTGAVPDLTSHPLPHLSASGLKVTINTDDPLVFGITLTDELFRATQHMSMSLDDIKEHTIAAAEAAFLPDGKRAELVKQFQNWLYPQNDVVRKTE